MPLAAYDSDVKRKQALSVTRDVIVLVINLAAFVILLATVVRVDHILVRIVLILPILGSALGVAVRGAILVMTLRGRDIANSS